MRSVLTLLNAVTDTLEPNFTRALSGIVWPTASRLRFEASGQRRACRVERDEARAAGTCRREVEQHRGIVRRQATGGHADVDRATLLDRQRWRGDAGVTEADRVDGDVQAARRLAAVGVGHIAGGTWASRWAPAEVMIEHRAAEHRPAPSPGWPAPRRGGSRVGVRHVRWGRTPGHSVEEAWGSVGHL